MQSALPEKQLIDTILEAVFLAVLVAFVVALIISVLAVFVIMRFSGAAWAPVFVLRLSVPIGIVSALVTSYRYVVTRTDAKSRVRQVYAILCAIIASAFAFSWYQLYRDNLLIKDVCTQFDQAIMQKDYEAAYEFMSPSYRRAYTIEQFIDGSGKEFESCKPIKGYVVEVSIGARVASIVPYPLGSLNTKIILEQVNGKWYFTGESLHFPA